MVDRGVDVDATIPISRSWRSRASDANRPHTHCGVPDCEHFVQRRGGAHLVPQAVSTGETAHDAAGRPPTRADERERRHAQSVGRWAGRAGLRAVESLTGRVRPRARAVACVFDSTGQPATSGVAVDAAKANAQRVDSTDRTGHDRRECSGSPRRSRLIRAACLRPARGRRGKRHYTRVR